MDNIMSSKLFTTRQGTILLGVIAAVIAAIALIVYLNHYRNSVSAPPRPGPGRQQADPAGDVRRRPPHESQLLRDAAVHEEQRRDRRHPGPGDARRPGRPDGHLAGPAADGVRLRCQRNSSVQQAEPASARGRRGARLAAGRRQPDRRRQPRRLLGLDQFFGIERRQPSRRQAPVPGHVRLGVNGGNVTLRGTPTQAGQIIYASTNDSIWLVLRPTVGTITKPPVISSRQVTGG